MLTAKVQCLSKEPVEGEEGAPGVVLVNFGADDDAAANEWAVGTPHLTLTLALSAERAGAYAASEMYTLTLAKVEAE